MRELTAFEILEKWAKFAEFDPNQKKFNLLSSNYLYHKAGKNIMALGEGYDPTGAISALYAKSVFLNVMKDSRVILYDLLENPDGLQDVQEMWEVFHSPAMEKMEKAFLMDIDQLIGQVAGKHMLTGDTAEGGSDHEMLQTLLRATESVAEELSSCNVDLFQKGGDFLPIKKFSTHIHVFNLLSECLMALQTTADGMYLCYITCDGKVDGYFTFMLKSNGNILSINERIEEAYVGQHTKRRNNRWIEGKKENIFPYRFIINSSSFDYKGYAKDQFIDEDSLEFFRLGPNAFLPLVLAMVMLNNRYGTGQVLDLPTKYVDSLMQVNLSIEAKEHALAVPADNSLILAHKAFELGFTQDDVLSGAGAEQFGHQSEKTKEFSYLEKGCFYEDCPNQVMVEAWGEGFVLENQHIFERLPLSLPEEESPYYHTEFVGSEQRMRMEAYRCAREQLAEYIRKNVFQEYIKMDGMAGIRTWRETAYSENREQLMLLAAKAILTSRTHCSDFDMDYGKADNLDKFIYDNSRCRIMEGKHPESRTFGGCMLNKELKTPAGYSSGTFECLITGTVCSIFVQFTPKTWEDLELLTGAKVPKVLIGWQNDRRYPGNDLLNSTDPVDYIGTPIELNERFYYGSYYYGEQGEAYKRLQRREETCRSGLPMSVVIGFSKRGLARFLKEKGI